MLGAKSYDSRGDTEACLAWLDLAWLPAIDWIVDKGILGAENPLQPSPTNLGDDLGKMTKIRNSSQKCKERPEIKIKILCDVSIFFSEENFAVLELDKAINMLHYLGQTQLLTDEGVPMSSEERPMNATNLKYFFCAKIWKD